jgi:hypothetical protein
MIYRTILCCAFIIGSNLLEAQNEELFNKDYTYQTLSPYLKKLVGTFLLDEMPIGKNLSDILSDQTSIRSKTRLAQSLLFRNEIGDLEKATYILNWILSHQHKDETKRIFGSWKTNVTNDRLDENWREFIGCDLIIILENYRKLLSPELISSIENSLYLAAKGAFIRNVGAEYTNISIMSSFLLDYVGSLKKDSLLSMAGLKKAEEIFNLYHSNKSFSEFNSPTYYGVSMIGLALWRKYAVHDDIKKMGMNLENKLWNETVTFYHPNLKNMAGPYFRAYGMDMQQYFSIIGLWISVALDDETKAPMPPGKGPKYGEMSNISSILHLGLSIPQTVLDQFNNPNTKIFLQKAIPNKYKGDALKMVTMQMDEHWMMGGLWGNLRKWEQIKSGTIHWLNKNKEINWLMILGDGKTNVKIADKKMDIYPSQEKIQSMEFFIYATDQNPETFKNKNWLLPTIQLKLKTQLKKFTAVKIDDLMALEKIGVSENIKNIYRITFEIPDTWEVNKKLISIKPVRLNSVND